MKGKMNQQTARQSIRFFACLVMAAGVLAYASAALTFGWQPDPQAKKDEPANPVVENFIKQAKEYVKLRERIEGKMPKLSQEATPQQIEAHQEALELHRSYAETGEDTYLKQAAAAIVPVVEAHLAERASGVCHRRRRPFGGGRHGYLGGHRRHGDSPRICQGRARIW